LNHLTAGDLTLWALTNVSKPLTNVSQLEDAMPATLIR
jgi:hypothetical protein